MALMRAAHLGVAEVRSNVATFLYSAIHKFHWARGCEVQRAEAVAHHQSRSKYQGFIPDKPPK